MATSRKQERRLLSKDEFELIEQSHQPALSNLQIEELSHLIALVRERRDRARSLAHRQRRQVRGKARDAAPAPEHKDAGNRRKTAILAEALARLNSERARRTARARLIESAHRALAMSRAKPKSARPDPGRTAGEGMQPNENERAERIGSPMEAGRVSQFVRDAQARRDAR